VRIHSTHVWAYPTSDSYAVAVLAPSWRRLRLRPYHSTGADHVEAFFHFAAQYVARSRQLQATTGLAIVYGCSPNFRLGGLQSWPSVEVRSLNDCASHLEQYPPDSEKLFSQGVREAHVWSETLNTLDPLIHRAAFQYWRARALANAGFWEEPLVALDCLSAVAAEAAQRWLGLPEAPSRRSLAQLLGLSPDDGDAMARVYELRCAFGAHAAHSKWWDFPELYEDEIDASWEWSKRLLWSLARLESAHRKVDPAPESWSQWFVHNADWLYDAVWFDRVP
jgi:hypothetical protein